MIKFFRPYGKYGFLSNFSNHPIVMNGVRWPTVEHYFQAQKFEDADHRESIRSAKSPAAAKRLGRSRSFTICDDWDAKRDAVMAEALMAKFSQNMSAKVSLVETGDETLVEDSPFDDYWGIGNGAGLNRLGVLLMETRDRVRFF